MIFNSSFYLKLLLLLVLPIFYLKPVNSQPGMANANGISLAFETFGNKNNEVIVLIQGTGATLLHYPVELCEQLSSEGYYVVRFDNRDIGLSTHLESLGQPDWAAIGPYIGKCDSAPLPYSLLDMAEDVTGLMDALDVRQAHIVGASMGGAIAQLVAINFPERVLTLTCLSSSTGNPELPPGDEAALKAMSEPPPSSGNPDEIARHLVNVYKALGAVDADEVLYERALDHVVNRNWDPLSVNRQVAAVVIGESCDRRNELAQLKVPAMVIHGDSDPLVTLESGKDLKNSIPGAELCIIEGLGHDISLRYIDEISKCIIESLANYQHSK